MTDSNLPKKKKVTLKASVQAIGKAENAIIRLGFESKSKFAESQRIGRSTVTKFFQGKPIQLDSFKRICDGLQLIWQQIAGMSPAVVEKQKSSLGIELNISDETEEVGKMPTLRRQVTVVDPNSEKVKAVITLDGDVDLVDTWEIIQLLLRQNSGSSINIIDIESGSIRLTVEGSQADIQKLVDKIQSEELTELNSLPVVGIEILTKNSDTEKNDKWNLVKEIVDYRITDHRITDRSLSDADLSDADLSRADLSRADLSGANLSGANLSDADLSRANLSRVKLSRADLSGAYLSGADVEKTIFGNNQGISESMKLDLKLRGAIFEDFPGDRLIDIDPQSNSAYALGVDPGAPGTAELLMGENSPH